jgi:HK97 family phage major capsid protein
VPLPDSCIAAKNRAGRIAARLPKAGDQPQLDRVLEGDAVIRGNGVNRPTGMINTAPTSTPDAFPPTRAAAAYQYVPTTSSGAITPDSLITLTFAVNSEYRANGSWAMNSATLGVIRKLKEATTNAYLYQPGLIAGQPDLLLGYPIRLWEQMDDINTDTFPVAFGDFRRAYVLVDRVGLRITRDQVTNPGHVRFYVRRREGGHVLNNDAAKFLKCSAS